MYQLNHYVIFFLKQKQTKKSVDLVTIGGLTRQGNHPTTSCHITLTHFIGEKKSREQAKGVCALTI